MENKDDDDDDDDENKDDEVLGRIIIWPDFIYFLYVGLLSELSEIS